jgi:hypothetical protein
MQTDALLASLREEAQQQRQTLAQLEATLVTRESMLHARKVRMESSEQLLTALAVFCEQLTQRVDDLAAQCRKYEANLSRSTHESETFAARASAAEQLNSALISSKSWRMTQPLRSAIRKMRELRAFVFRQVRQAGRFAATSPVARAFFRYVKDHPQIRRQLLTLARFLGVADSLFRVYDTQVKRLTDAQSDTHVAKPHDNELQLTEDQSRWLRQVTIKTK